MEKHLVTMKLSEIIPYKNNPRKNKSAVKTVAESIRQTGYNNPIIVDENKVILAGHTRRLSLIQQGVEEVQVLQVLGLSETAKKKFRQRNLQRWILAVWLWTGALSSTWTTRSRRKRKRRKSRSMSARSAVSTSRPEVERW